MIFFYIYRNSMIMKIFRGIRYLLPFLILIGCATGSNRITFGPGYYGKNKLVKTEAEEKSASHSELERANSPLFLTEAYTVEDTLKQSPIDDPLELPAPRIIENSTTSIQNEANKIESIKANIRTIKKSNSKVFGKNAPLSNMGDDSGKLVVIILIILLLSVLLGILLFYLIITLLNQALNDAVDEACYVATMTYGSYDHPKVMVLRNFRDEFLAERKWGKQFIRWYYRHSPSFVKVYQNNRFVNGYLRIYLNVFIFFISPFYKK